MSTHQYKKLIVWEKSIKLVELIYKAVKLFPEDEKYGLVTQLKRCAVAIPSNIAEGSRRGTKKDFRRFILIAFGSGAELETQIEISKRLGFISVSDLDDINNLLEEVMKMLNKLQNNFK